MPLPPTGYVEARAVAQDTMTLCLVANAARPCHAPRARAPTWPWPRWWRAANVGARMQANGTGICTILLKSRDVSFGLGAGTLRV